MFADWFAGEEVSLQGSLESISLRNRAKPATNRRLCCWLTEQRVGREEGAVLAAAMETTKDAAMRYRSFVMRNRMLVSAAESAIQGLAFLVPVSSSWVAALRWYGVDAAALWLILVCVGYNC